MLGVIGIIINNPVTAEVSRSALRRNFELVSELSGGTPLLCVVKANAYGHGAEECSRIFYNEGARWFGVSSLKEALPLRESLPDDANILIFGYTAPEDIQIVAGEGIVQTVFSEEYALRISERLRETGSRRLRAHLKLDTGMNRIGFQVGALEQGDDSGIRAALRVCGLRELDLEGVFTHFACADEPELPMTDLQIDRFNRALERMSSLGVEFGIRHAANSAATINRPDAHYELNRSGITLYGLLPDPAFPDPGLVPAMTLSSLVSHVKTIEAGEAVGYGATYIAEKRMQLATITAGYADGFIRAYSGCRVLIGRDRQPAQIVGRICMDQCMADVTGLDVHPGDRVELFGPDLSVAELAARAGSIGYESVCLIGHRVPRIYT